MGEPQRVSLIGYGAIGHEIHAALRLRSAEASTPTLAGVLDLFRPEDLPAGVPFAPSIEDLIETEPDIIVECAGHAAVAAYAEQVLNAGIDIIIISIGALADAELEGRLRQSAGKGGAQIILPSGAIAAIDALGAARRAGLSSVTYRSRKPPHAWAGVAGASQIDLASLTQAAILYSGTAREAARLYPKNANVAATVAMAGLGFDATRVELVADPAAVRNSHSIHAEGAFGRLHMEIENAPSARNPRTSAITAYSILHSIENRNAAIVV
jgi:aspartate dehydrogenase